mgnify:FL=1
MQENKLEIYNLGFVKYLERKFSGNDLGIKPMGKDYSSGFRGEHKPFEFRFASCFLYPEKNRRNHVCDFYFELDFPDTSMTEQLESEIGIGHRVNDGRLSKIIYNVRRSYYNSAEEGREILTIDSDIALIPEELNHLYQDIWASLLRRPFSACMGIK